MSFVAPPIVTIISVTFNCVNEIENTIRSVSNFKSSNNLQYVIVDGMSTDGTVSMIKKHQDNIDVFISEPDKGIYDAMNKGWSFAKGRYILFVNAGDVLLNLPLDLLANAFDDGVALISGLVKDQNGRITKSEFCSKLKFRNTLPHQGLFYKTSIELRYDLTYKVFSDFDMNQRLFKHNVSWLGSDTIICMHDTTGISNMPTFFYEVFDIIKKNFGLYYKIKAWVYHKLKSVEYRVKRIKNG